MHVYNIPKYTKVHFSADLLTEIGKIPGVEAVKDSSADLIRTQQFIHSSGLDVFQGNEMLYLSSLVVGAAGCISGGVCVVFPDWLPSLLKEFGSGNLAEAMEIQHRITTSVMALTIHPNWAQVWKQCIHYVWGFDMGTDIMGYSPLCKEDKAVLKRALQAMRAI
jgi:N-acetylneuraminate lyase